MKNKEKQQRITRHFAFLFTCLCTVCTYGQLQESNLNLKQLYEAAEAKKFNSNDSSIALFNQCIDESYHTRDTLFVIRCLLGRSNLYGHNASFDYAYDGYWKALLLSDQIGDSHAKAAALYGLGWLYSLYKRDSIAEKYFKQALTLKKSTSQDAPWAFTDKGEVYYALATQFRRQEKTELARKYLDSCLIERGFSLKDIQSALLRAELGYNFLLEENYEEALNWLSPLESYFITYYPSYLVIYHAMLAKVYAKMGKMKLGKQLYESAIQSGLQHKSHMDLMPDVYEDFSKLLTKMGDWEAAYDALMKSKELNQSQFDSRSTKNRRFIEIKDEYRQIKEAKQKQFQQQVIERLKQKDEISRLKGVIAYATIIFLILTVFLTYRYLRSRYHADKKLLIERRNLEQKKAKEVLEIKNKELTSSALQLIQREEILSDLKKELEEQRKYPSPIKIGKLAQSIQVNNAGNWGEFEARFVDVNKQFYQSLRDKFPDLTQGDQKICALVKLNFDSKDMARLLGISVESVHTTRYRLRKKLGLKRSDNLEEFISRIG